MGSVIQLKPGLKVTYRDGQGHCVLRIPSHKCCMGTPWVVAAPLQPLEASRNEAWRGQYRGPCQEIQWDPCWARAYGEGRALHWESRTADRSAYCRSW